MKKTLMMVLTATLLGFGSIASAATDYSHYSDKELGALRGTMRKASVEDRIAYHQEWQKRLGELGPDQRQRFMKSPGGRGFNCDMNGMNGMGRMGRMQGMQGSQGFNCGMNGMQGSPGMNCGMNRMEESLGLNDSQSAKVKELREKQFALVIPEKKELVTLNQELQKESFKASPDKRKIDELSVAIGKKHTSLAQLKSSHLTELASILTPAQREKMQLMRDARQMRQHGGWYMQ